MTYMTKHRIKLYSIITLIGIIAGALFANPPSAPHTNQDHTAQSDLYEPGHSPQASADRILDVVYNMVMLEQLWATNGYGDNCWVPLHSAKGCEDENWMWIRTRDGLDYYAWWLVMLQFCPSHCEPEDACYTMVEVEVPCSEAVAWVDMLPFRRSWGPDYVPPMDCPPPGYGPAHCHRVKPLPMNRLDPCLNDCACGVRCPEIEDDS